ncbi:hypothetical protein GBF38_007420 [Nibea albiflora]|uniref:Uncharacterized protein n=1 Tax=Nibea albiflora TaxID=240163 RepID=A0ACB7EIL8_NIBAL|nr:hypothetical protein GBF38_007420 [Nibea albiflora]
MTGVMYDVIMTSHVTAVEISETAMTLNKLLNEQQTNTSHREHSGKRSEVIDRRRNITQDVTSDTRDIFEERGAPVPAPTSYHNGEMSSKGKDEKSWIQPLEKRNLISRYSGQSDVQTCQQWSRDTDSEKVSESDK